MHKGRIEESTLLQVENRGHRVEEPARAAGLWRAQPRLEHLGQHLHPMDLGLHLMDLELHLMDLEQGLYQMPHLSLPASPAHP